jgi:hypothetical protein
MLPPGEVLAEQAYLVARGVRRLSLAGHCAADDADALLRVATEVERHAEHDAIPFVIDHRDGVASYGYSEASWVVDLYEWAVTDPAVPEEQRHRIAGLLLGYSAPAVSHHDSLGSGRRFAAAKRPHGGLRRLGGQLIGPENEFSKERDGEGVFAEAVLVDQPLLAEAREHLIRVARRKGLG